ncbi:MAG: TIGR00299 family protein [Planctomycetota bacterium]|nr:MAG: TIGR00299 family protein [Planctomycetota bacterium]
MKTAFFDLSSGVAGDMIISSLLSAGLDYKLLLEGLSTLGVPEFEIHRSVKKRSSLEGEYIEVLAKDQQEKTHNHEHHHGEHRHLKTIIEIIQQSKIPDVVKKNAVKVFELLGDAEAKVHGVPIEKIHFHEVGALDSIVDIVGGCLGLHLLGIEKIYFNEFHFGKGSIECAHGKMPIPVPATIKISSGFECIYTDVAGELTTPTGSAMMAVLGDQVSIVPKMTTMNIGYGAGKNEYQGVMGLLRVIVGISSEENLKSQRVFLVETNIDDMSPEILSNTCMKLLNISEQDVWTETINMKKNRVGQKICILCNEDKLPLIENVLFQETSTFGFRYQVYNKVEWDRKVHSIELYGEEIRMKIKILNGEEKIFPEFEDCKKIATLKDISLLDVYKEAIASMNN